MKKIPKIVQCDKRGQIVIPKEIRIELGIDETTGFWAYVVCEQGILLKKVDAPELENDEMLHELDQKSDKIDISKEQLEQTKKDYKKTHKSGMELI